MDLATQGGGRGGRCVSPSGWVGFIQKQSGVPPAVCGIVREYLLPERQSVRDLFRSEVITLLTPPPLVREQAYYLSRLSPELYSNDGIRAAYNAIYTTRTDNVQ